MPALFRSEEPEERSPTPEPPKKKQRFFEEPDDDPDVIVLGSPTPALEEKPVAGSSRLANQKANHEASAWDARYFGDIVVEGYTLYRQSTLCSLKPLEAVSLHRMPPPIVQPGKKQKDLQIVRFKNSKGSVVGRINEKDAVWIAKLLDLGVASFTGTCVHVDRNFNSGASVVLSLSPFISRTAFTDPNVPRVLPVTTMEAGGKTFHADLKETEHERALRERKSSLNALFDKANLQPTRTATASAKKGKGTAVSKRALLEKYSGAVAKRKTKGGDDDDDDGEEMDANQLSMVYSKAIKNDAFLPEMDPPDTFALTLRGYQKQALKWMSSMEEGDSDARDEMSLHPLWEEYVFPHQSGSVGSDEQFWYNPYSGDLSLEFPKASKRCGSGILADEMGLGKTIMVAALLCTNTAQAAAARREKANALATSGSEDDDEDDDLLSSDDNDDDEKPYIPSPTRRVRPTQVRFGGDGKLKSLDKTRDKVKLGANAPRATLVVAPMTLLSQWCDELERSTNGEMNVLMYYGNNRSNIQQEISDNNVDVVVTSYGTLVSDFKASGGGEDETKATEKAKGSDKKHQPKRRRKGLFSIEWFRVVLDEAHLIKSRTTQNAKACYALRAQRRWCLSGTPIVNRLEDLYSLLHFIQLEPWGNHSFFRSFITLPFEKKDPKAIEIIQVVLESILLRREKSMKDRDGNPIVALPAKHVKIVNLSFSDEERLIYEAIYKNAKSQFLGYAAQGTVLQNVTAIFSILMRLRQAVLHPSLVLKRLAENLTRNKKIKGRTAGEHQSDLDDESIKNLISRYGGGSSDLQDLLDAEENDVQECCLCLDAAEAPVKLPCGHIGCQECILEHFSNLEEQGEDAHCPVCKRRTTSQQLVQHSRGGRKPVKTAAPVKKKPMYTSSMAGSSGPGSSSQGEVLTILDTSDDDSDASPPPREKVPHLTTSNGKGKGKAKAESGTESDYVQDVNMGSLSDSDEEKDPPASPGPGDGLFQRHDGFKTSTKLTALIQSLKKIRADEPDVKAVVFSQFTGFLDIVERGLEIERFIQVRLDGTMSQGTREKVVHKFKASKTSMILLASLKAGGVGLNLVAATHVYLLDAWWNSSIEQQAIDRIHRFGQTREVFVTRFLITPSIDDKMIALQERKKRIINASLGSSGADGKNKKQLADDLALIFAD